MIIKHFKYLYDDLYLKVVLKKPIKVVYYSIPNFPNENKIELIKSLFESNFSHNIIEKLSTKAISFICKSSMYDRPMALLKLTTVESFFF